MKYAMKNKKIKLNTELMRFFRKALEMVRSSNFVDNIITYNIYEAKKIKKGRNYG